MELIKEENDDTRVSEECRVKDEDIKEQRGCCPFLIHLLMIAEEH